MDGRAVGSIIGTIGGLAFVLANSAGLTAATLLRLLALALAMGVVIAIVVTARRGAPPGERPPPAALRTYWLCVLAEVAAIPLGAAALRALDRPELVRVWVVLVLGAHFLPFARAFAAPLFLRLGLLLIATALVGGAALLAGVRDAGPWTAVLAGFLLLGFALGGTVLDGTRRTEAMSRA